MSSVEAQVEKSSVEDKKPEAAAPAAEATANADAGAAAGDEKAPEDKTVSESLDFSVVHPLDHQWTMWYLKPSQGQTDNWADSSKELVTVQSVEEFWGAFNSVPRVTQSPMRADFASFKKGIRPEWEDPANKNGGRWSAHLRMSEETDAKWLNISLSLIGNTLDTNDCVNGVFAMVRPKGTCRIQSWVKGDAQSSQQAARNSKNVSNMNERTKIEFQPFTPAEEGGLTVKIES